MKAILAAVLLSTAAASQAHTIGLHIGSKHFPAKHWNNQNPGIYFQHDSGWLIGGYRNSYNRTAIYLGKSWSTEVWGFEPTISAGLITGYKTPVMVAPSIATPDIQGFRARIAFLPKLEKSGSSVVHLMLEKKF